MNEMEKEKLKARALMNEYIYSMMKDIGVSIKMDEKIGIEFLEMGNMKIDVDWQLKRTLSHTSSLAGNLKTSPHESGNAYTNSTSSEELK